MNPQRSRLYRQWRARPRLIIATAIAIVIGWWLPESIAHHAATRGLIAWNAGVALYLMLAALMMMHSSEHQMRRRAEMQDEGRIAILVFVVVAALASVVAIGGQLSVVRDMHGGQKIAHVALAGVTVLSSWAFMQVMFALHYAHDYYAALSRGAAPCLQFPGDDKPTYGDFFYFAAVIGTSGQTADVPFASKRLRRVGTVHCILAYLFNTTVLALLINIGASLV